MKKYRYFNDLFKLCYATLHDLQVIVLYIWLILTFTPFLKDNKLDSLLLSNHHNINQLEIKSRLRDIFIFFFQSSLSVSRRFF